MAQILEGQSLPGYENPGAKVYKGNRKPEAMDEVLAHLGGINKINSFTLDMVEAAEGKLEQYLWIEPNTRHRYGYCTACRERIDFYKCAGGTAAKQCRRWKHGQEVRCPCCGSPVTVLTRDKQIWQDAVFYWWQKSAINPQAIVGRLIWMEKGQSRENCESPTLYLRTDSALVFIYGKGSAMVMPEKGRSVKSWFFETYGLSYQMATKVKRRDGLYRVYANVRELDMDESFDEAAENTPFQYFDRKTYSKYGGVEIKALDMFTRYPSWEWLTKMGLSSVLRRYAFEEDVEAGNTWRILNFKGKTVNEIFKARLTKADKKYLYEGKIENACIIAVWQKWKSYLPDVSLEEVDELDRNTGRSFIYEWNTHRVDTACRFMDPKKALVYIQKQEARIFGGRITWRDMLDYVEDLETLHYDMSDKDNLYPADFRKAHEHTSKAAVILRNKVKEDKWDKRRQGMAGKYDFNDSAKGLAVMVPKHLSDLKDEGEQMHNCVGTYMERVANGQTDVVFVRRTAEPEKSYVTVEVQPATGNIIQARARFNRDIAEQETRDFIKEFENHVKTVMKKKDAASPREAQA